MNTMTKGELEIDGFQLSYTIEGTGRPAIVIGSSIYYPRTFSQSLRQNLRLIFVDHRGFGKAPKTIPANAYDLDKLIDDIEKVRKTLSLDQIIIIGHSGHGYMALEYAKKYSEHVTHVVLIGMGPDQSAKSHQAAAQYLEEFGSPERKQTHSESVKKLPQEIERNPDQRFITFCIRLGALSWFNPHFDATSLWDGVQVNMPMFDQVWGETFRDLDITQGLVNFDRPVFLALGRYDFLVAPPHTWDPIRGQFKNLTLKIFEKSGHTPQYEEPALFDQALIEWLSQ